MGTEGKIIFKVENTLSEDNEVEASQTTQVSQWQRCPGKTFSYELFETEISCVSLNLNGRGWEGGTELYTTWEVAPTIGEKRGQVNTKAGLWQLGENVFFWSYFRQEL